MEPSFFIIVAGDPVDGFKYFGPYMSRDDALSEAQRHKDDSWWIVPLENSYD